MVEALLGDFVSAYSNVWTSLIIPALHPIDRANVDTVTEITRECDGQRDSVCKPWIRNYRDFETAEHLDQTKKVR
jgi:hypothetical protein